MGTHEEHIEHLRTLNHIADTLNRSTDVRGALNAALARLVDVMGVETGWIFLRDPADQDKWWGKGYTLVAHHSLPSALALDEEVAWKGGCDCQALCTKGQMTDAYNEVRCSRLAASLGDRRGLAVHASAPLRSGEQVLGILNVAAADWSAFTPETLAVLANVGSQMGTALERARLYDMLQERRIHEQAVLLELSNQLLSRREPDDIFQYLVHEARRLLQADACALLLPTSDGRYLTFHAATGWLSDPMVEGYRIPADERSGSGLVMLAQQPLLIEDLTLEQPRFPAGWLEPEGFRGHAIVPLVADGHSIGALVINTREPRLFSDGEVRLLQLMANQAAIAIENARLHVEDLRRQRLEEELSLGRRIQLSLLPEACPVVPGWDFATVYEAARVVGGDFYDYFELPTRPGQALDADLRGDYRRMGLVIADVADKGVPAALFMALSRTMIRTTALSDRTPAAALVRANRLILSDSQTDLFLTAFYAQLETESGRLLYSNAGHNPPLWLQASNGAVRELTVPGIVLGVLENIELRDAEVELALGDILVLYTDGVTEAINDYFEEFGVERLRAVLAANPAGNAQEIAQAIVDAVGAFTGNLPQADDFTLLVVKRCGDC